MKKILPIAKSPIQGFQFHAYPLSILMTQESSLAWFYSNYIHLRCNKHVVEDNGLVLDFEMGHHNNLYPIDIPLLLFQKIYKNTLFDLHIDIHEFIMNNLNENYYLYTFVDEFFIPNRMAYNKDHFFHDLLIYGYDRQEQHYYICGYNHNGLFTHTTLSFEQFEKGFSNERSNCIYFENVMLYKLNDGAKYDFDMELVKESINEYIMTQNSNPSNRKFQNPKDYAFGVDVYPYLNTYIEGLIEDKLLCDIKPLSILWEHKKCMLMRIKYMEEKQNIPSLSVYYDNYQLAVEKKALMIRSMLVKYDITRNKNILLEIKPYINEIWQSEVEILQGLLDEMKKSENESFID